MYKLREAGVKNCSKNSSFGIWIDHDKICYTKEAGLGSKIVSLVGGIVSLKYLHDSHVMFATDSAMYVYVFKFRL